MAAVETVTGSFVSQITGKWQYHDGTCGNLGFVCFPFGKVGYLRIIGPEIVLWNEVILGGRATLEQPLAGVIATCVQRKSKLEGKSRKTMSPTKGLSSNGPTIININTGGFLGIGTAQSDSLRSSPPVFKGSEVENLCLYLRWLVSKGYLEGKVGCSAEEALIREA